MHGILSNRTRPSIDHWKKEITPPDEDVNNALSKCRIKMFALKTTVNEDMLEHIRDNKIPKEIKGFQAIWVTSIQVSSVKFICIFKKI